MTDDTSTVAEQQPLDRFQDGADGGPLGRIQATRTITGGLKLDREWGPPPTCRPDISHKCGLARLEASLPSNPRELVLNPTESWFEQIYADNHVFNKHSGD